LVQKPGHLATITLVDGSTAAMFKHFPPPSAIGPVVTAGGGWASFVAATNGELGDDYLACPSSVTQSPFLWMTHIGAMFTGVRGGISVKVSNLDHDDEALLVLQTYHAYNETMPLTGARSLYRAYRDLGGEAYLDQLVGIGTVNTNLITVGQGHVGEMRFNYESPRKYENPRCFQTIPVETETHQFDATQYFVLVNPEGGPYENVNVYLSGAEDFSVTRFRRVPSLIAPILYGAPG
jgi:hypothetical protein